MVLNLFNLNPQGIGQNFRRIAVFRNLGQLAENQAAQGGVAGIRIFLIWDAERLTEIFKVTVAGDAPEIFAERRDIKHFGLIGFIVNVADDFFKQVFQRNQTGGAAVFIDNDCQVNLFLLHIAEQRVSMNGFRNKVNRGKQVAERFRGAAANVQQVFPRQQNAQNIIGIFAADRQTGETAVHNGFVDIFRRVVRPDDGHILAVNHEVAGCGVVEFKDVVDHFAFFGFNRAAFFTEVNHHADFIFRDGLFLFVRIHTEQAQNAVCRDGEEPDDRLQNL